MKNYIAPQVTDWGNMASLTGLTNHPTEHDTFVTAEGQSNQGEGPVSEIFCETTNDLEICQ